MYKLLTNGQAYAGLPADTRGHLEGLLIKLYDYSKTSSQLKFCGILALITSRIRLRS